MKKYSFSEIFWSVQGEGKYTGVGTAWLRFFLCNLQCEGFGQKDPKDPSTYILPYKTIDIKDVKRLEDLPVFEYGCDSSYSWSAKYKHLQHRYTAIEIASLIAKSMITEYNPKGLFDIDGRTWQHMCFTGGEPLMKAAQECASELMEIWEETNNNPQTITWETNTTQPLSDQLISHLTNTTSGIFCSSSPKLYSVSGEKDAVKLDILEQYASVFGKSSSDGQLKFVINGSKDSWEELEHYMDIIRNKFICWWPVYIMPAGGTLEGQRGLLEGHNNSGEIATEALRRGYNVSARVHIDLWGNKIGT